MGLPTLRLNGLMWLNYSHNPNLAYYMLVGIEMQGPPVNPTYTFLLEVIAHCHLPSNSSGLELTWTQSINVQYLC
jgi:hypothetical protein